MKKTKIICTIGPASSSKDIISNLLQNGMDIVRLNFSHGHRDDHIHNIITVRQTSLATNKPVAIMLDTKGPEIRTLSLKNGEPVELKQGSNINISTDKSFIGDKNCFAISYPNLIKDISIGHRILIDDGLIELIVNGIDNKQIQCQVITAGTLREYKKVNLPNTAISLPILSKQDKLDLQLACQKQIDFIAVSLIKKPSDITEIRNFIDSNGGENIAIIAKIENQQSLDNFDDILSVADGIMVARGDFGNLIATEEVILAQKMIVKKCNLHAKPVIVATHMLESMTTHPRPTRAEAGDVTNAILDGADAVMLSAETAKGNYPLASLKMMAKICQTTDNHFNYHNIQTDELLSLTGALNDGAVVMSQKINASVIVVITHSGEEARVIRHFSPQAQILAITYNPHVFNQLLLVKGVYPYLMKHLINEDTLIKQCQNIVLNQRLAKPNEKIIIIYNNRSIVSEL